MKKERINLNKLQLNLEHDGKKNDEISKKFKVSKSYVYNKKKEYREMGLI